MPDNETNADAPLSPLAREVALLAEIERMHWALDEVLKATDLNMAKAAAIVGLPKEPDSQSLETLEIDITTNHDSFECDCCGVSYAEGGDVSLGGTTVLSRPASASCIGSESWSDAELLVMALKKLGIAVMVDGSPYHVGRHDRDYHGPL
jgi:hypothetical protein